MINLPKITDLEVNNKKVLVRADLDVEEDNFASDLRIQSLVPTLDHLKSKNAKIVVIGHRGRPTGEAKKDQQLSLKFLEPFFNKWEAQVKENLRFDPREERNDFEYAKELALLGEVFINEAFAASHREHASIVGIPKLLPHAAGLRFIAEVENLSRGFNNPTRPVISIIGGAKEDKLNYLEGLAEISDSVLIGGALPKFIAEDSSLRANPKFLVANLIADKEDLTVHSIEEMEKKIESAGTILLAGPMGKFEEEGHSQGTKRVFEKVAASPAFKIVGGGDSLRAVKIFSLEEKFNWVSVGGGAMLEFITKKTLSGIEALK
jgi:phosphoglycerate kinase